MAVNMIYGDIYVYYQTSVELFFLNIVMGECYGEEHCLLSLFSMQPAETRQIWREVELFCVDNIFSRKLDGIII